MKIYGSGLLQAKMKPFNDKKVLASVCVLYNIEEGLCYILCVRYYHNFTGEHYLMPFSAFEND